MDIQYHGGNCIVLTGKGVRVVVDDYLANLGLKSIAKQNDILLFSEKYTMPDIAPRLIVDGPGEYEVANLAIIGIAARAHMDEPEDRNTTMYRLVADEVTYLFPGNIYPELSEDQLEAIGMVDVMFVPTGGNGYALDATGALQLIKAIEPKIVIPTHYDDASLRYPVVQQPLEHILKNLAMEPTETVAKFRYKPVDLSGNTQLVVLSRT